MSQLTMSTLVNTLMPDQKSYARIPDIHSIPTLIKRPAWNRSSGSRPKVCANSRRTSLPSSRSTKEYSLYFPAGITISRTS